MADEFTLDFLGIGVVKSGTTWLANCLREHPEIYLPQQKEIFFFDYNKLGSNYSRGFRWYKKYFKNASNGKKKGEFTAHYMFSPESCGLIHKHMPNIKLIACLRRPDEMLYSFYWWKKANHDFRNCASTFEKELVRDREMLKRGLYYKQLKPYFEIFHRKDIKIIFYNDIKSNPSKVLKDVYTFLGVRGSFKPSVFREKINRAKTVRYKPPADLLKMGLSVIKRMGMRRLANDLVSNTRLWMIYSAINKKNFIYPDISVVTKKKLVKYYESDIRKLEKLLGVSLGIWLKY